MSLGKGNTFGSVFDPQGGRLGLSVRQQNLQEKAQSDLNNFRANQVRLQEAQLRLRQQAQDFDQKLAQAEELRKDKRFPKELEILDRQIETMGQNLLNSKKDLETKTFQLGNQRAEAASRFLKNVKTPKDLEKANEALMKYGILPEGNPIESLGQARLLYEGSVLYQRQQELKQKGASAQQLQRQKALLTRKLEQERAALKLTSDVGLEQLKHRHKLQQEAEKKRLGTGGGIKIQNILPGATPEQASGLLGAKQYRNGGMLQAGEVGVVGEDGPELFVPNQSGTVVPNPNTMQMAQNSGVNRLNDIINPALERAEQDYIRTNEALMRQQAQQPEGPSRDLSVTDAASVSSAQTALSQINDLLKLDKEGKLGKDAWSQLLQKDWGVLDTPANFLRTANDQEVLKLKKNITSIVTKIRSGAAVTDKERAYLASLLPAPGDTPEIQTSKLKSFREEFRNFLYNAKADELGIKRLEHGSGAVKDRNDFVDAFLKANPNATVEDALQYLEVNP